MGCVVSCPLSFFAGLIIVPILAPSLKLFPPYDRELDKPLLNGLIMAGVVVAMMYFFPSAEQLRRRVDMTYPRKALEFMREHDLQGRIFNQYAWGGYLEWNAPEYKTFIDGRADIFIYNGTFSDFLSATALNNSAEILDRYKIDYVLIPPNGPLSYLLLNSTGWQLVYSDQVSALFRRE